MGGNGAIEEEGIGVSGAEVVGGEDELTLPEPFYFDADAHMAQEEGTSTDQILEPSSAPAPEET